MAKVTDLSDQLRAQGVGPEDVVATVLPRGGNSIIAMLGIWMTGAAYLPVDVKWPERRRELVLAEVATFALEASDGEAHGGIPGESGLRVRRLREGRARIDGASATERNLAYVICTSGSTGTPLAVCVEFGALDNYARYLRDLMKQPGVHDEVDLRVLLSADLAFGASLRPVLLLAAGAELVVAPDLTEGSWQEHIDCIAEHKVTVLSGVPSWYSGLLAAGYVPGDSAVRLAFIGGEAVPNGVVRQLAASQRVVVQYGPTETTVAATGGRVVDDGFLEAPIGEPLPGTQIHLYGNAELDPAIDGEPAIPVRGRLWRGARVPEQSAADRGAIHPEPFRSAGLPALPDRRPREGVAAGHLQFPRAIGRPGQDQRPHGSNCPRYRRSSTGTPLSPSRSRSSTATPRPPYSSPATSVIVAWPKRGRRPVFGTTWPASSPATRCPPWFSAWSPCR